MSMDSMKDVPSISQNEFKVLKFLSDHSQNGQGISESDISITEMSNVQIASSISWLENKNLITARRIEKVYYSLGKEAIRFLEHGLPEENVYRYCISRGSLPLAELVAQFGEGDTRIALTQLSKYGIRPVDGKISVVKSDEVEKDLENKKAFLKSLKGSGTVTDPKMLEHFKKRKDSIIERKKITREVVLTDLGKKAVSLYSHSDFIEEVTQDIISIGAWKKREFREYDLSSQVEPRISGFVHPLSLLIAEIKRIFMGMGFSEMPGHYMEYAGWNMDALFIPQDHPARDMQDTFFLKSTKKPAFEHEEILDILKNVHERGIKGYSGWGYAWSSEKARELLLRTHTTVSTIRYLYEHKDAPQAIFSVGKVFRHESVDWKHLAELNQIEGAYYARDASLSTLKWLITEFYGRLGFNKLKFVPSYYPYTEPSMDVVAHIAGREVELGGSGVFRPEVTEPLGLRGRVLAWGLGLERLAMLYYGLDDVRKIYQSDIEWLRTFHIVTH